MAGDMDDPQCILKRMKSRGCDDPRDMINGNQVDSVVYFGNKSELRTSLDKSQDEVVSIRNYTRQFQPSSVRNTSSYRITNDIPGTDDRALQPSPSSFHHELFTDPLCLTITSR